MAIECAHCGNKELFQVPGMWTPLAIGEEGLVNGPAVPTVFLVCTSCGFMSLFSPQVVQPKPFPELPPDPPTPDGQ